MAQGAKPPEVLKISHFLRPENGLGSYNFLSVLPYKDILKYTFFSVPCIEYPMHYRKMRVNQKEILILFKNNINAESTGGIVDGE